MEPSPTSVSNPPSNRNSYDVIVLGGGLAGLCLARQLYRDDITKSILVLEKARFPVAEAAHKVGESSVELGAFYFEQILGLGEHIHGEHLPKLGLRFFFNTPGQQSLDKGVELGASSSFHTPSYQLDRGRFENYLVGQARKDGVQVLDGCKVQSVDLGEADHQIGFTRDGKPGQVSGRWVVDGSGRAGLLKRKLGLTESVPHQINAVWFRINAVIKVDHWGNWAQEQRGEHIPRWLSTNHLMGPGYWVWLIPLASGATSIGIVADPRLHPLSQLNRYRRALAWLEEHQPLCAAAIREADQPPMDFKVLRHFSHGCKQVFSGDRWALTGEAGYFLDPFYSPGSDFIAINNIFICELIKKDLSRRPIGGLTLVFESVYRQLFENTLLAYHQQYPLFGNARIMTIKVIWDYAVYWSLPAYAVLQGHLTNIGVLARLQDSIAKLRDLNDRMQTFFREWHRVDSPHQEAAYIDQSQIPFLRDLNRDLTRTLERDDFERALQAKVEDLDALSGEILQRVNQIHPGIRVETTAKAPSNHLEMVFDKLAMVPLKPSNASAN